MTANNTGKAAGDYVWFSTTAVHGIKRSAPRLSMLAGSSASNQDGGKSSPTTVLPFITAITTTNTGGAAGDYVFRPQNPGT